ncbi:MAG TPA: TonB-dependent receptor [Candidatus Heimdallarchaeota archaeon]|nr:TonB-dependent receptor [Candidatus Heimdallarchaeota archaeon]
MCKRICRTLMIVAFLCFHLYSQDSQETEARPQEKQDSLQHEVVVTANRVETSIKEVASSVTIITREQLAKTGKSQVLEALEEAIGLSTAQNGPPGSQATVFIRGANAEHTLVMIDGTEVNDPITPTRSFDMSLLLVDNIDRIEILRGPQSTLYGSDAMGGVINIITRQDTGKPKIHLSGNGGSYGTNSGIAEVSGSTSTVRYSAAAALFDTDGFSAASTKYKGNKEADGHRNLTLSGRVGFDLAANLSLDFSARRIDTETDLDNSGGDWGDDPNHVQRYGSLFLMSQARGLFLRNRWEQKLQVSVVDYHRTSNNPVDESNPFLSEESEFKSKLWKLDWQNSLFLHKTNTLTFGVEHQREQGESWYRSESIFGPYESVFPRQKAHNTGLYVQDQLRFDERFFLTAGIRYDDHSLTESSTTYRIAPAYFIEHAGTKIKGTWGTGFKAPSLYQLYAPATLYGPAGNENLKPEKSTGWDLGVEQNFLNNTLLLGLTYFSNTFEDLIDYDFTQGYINISKAHTQGAEVTFSARPLPDLSLFATYTRTEAKNTETDEYLLRRPKDKFTARLDWGFLGRANIHVSMIYVGEREDLYWLDWTPTPVTLESYTLLNAAGFYDVFESLELFLRLDNILNTDYETIKGYGTAGFSIYGGIKAHF